MKSTRATYKKYSSAGVDWASWFLGIGLGLTLALQVTTMRKSDISSVYAVVASVSRLAALTGTFFAVVGIFLIARIPWVERGVGHDRLATWHRKLGPWSLYLIGAHVFFIVLSSAGQDRVMLVDGVDARKWIGREELAEYSFWTINRHDGTAWSYGSNKGY